jgi:hypothetical protein
VELPEPRCQADCRARNIRLETDGTWTTLVVKENMPVSIPAKCTKRRYPDRIAALMALASAQRRQEHPSYAVAGKRRETRVYRCPNCKGWHLTSG